MCVRACACACTRVRVGACAQRGTQTRGDADAGVRCLHLSAQEYLTGGNEGL